LHYVFIDNSYLSSEERESFQNVLHFYTPLVDHHITTAKLKLWKTKLLRINSIPKTTIGALSLRVKIFFSNIHKSLRILCKLPVSAATRKELFRHQNHI